MHINTVFLPKDFERHNISARDVVVFDVLRATTSMTAALNAGVSEIRIFEDLLSARAAAEAFGHPRILCGEENCLRPPGFDVGNSPGEFTRVQHAGRAAFMSTTNGTRAIVAALGASAIFAGALVNARAVATALTIRKNDVTLLCAGTGGAIAFEDLLGAGAVIEALRTLRGDARSEDDTSLLASYLFTSQRDNLVSALSQSTGGRNIISAGLASDIDIAARVDAVDVVGVIDSPLVGETPILRPFNFA